MAVVLFRLNSWKDVTISSTQQSLATIVGSTLGFTGIILLALRLTKKYSYRLYDLLFAKNARAESPVKDLHVSQVTQEVPGKAQTPDITDCSGVDNAKSLAAPNADVHAAQSTHTAVAASFVLPWVIHVEVEPAPAVQPEPSASPRRSNAADPGDRPATVGQEEDQMVVPRSNTATP